MTKVPALNHMKLLPLAGILLLSSLILISDGCQKSSPRPRSRSTARSQTNSDSSFLVDTLAKGLNNLPDEAVLELSPPFPVLDDAKSADGMPVLAACGKTPEVPDGPYNYLYVPQGNASFNRVGVKPGDIVRYFIDVDQESIEHGIEQVNYIELTVRRLYNMDPDNALIIEGGLPISIDFPERIEIWRFSDKRMNEIRQRITRFVKQPQQLISWEPTPDESALVQLLERANQWLRNLNSQEDDWKLEPLAKKLPSEILSSQPLDKLLTDEALENGSFAETEARQLQQAIWLRDTSTWAKADAVSPLEIATALFDWTIRNIQLEEAERVAHIHQLWQVLLYGRGTAEHRAWVFAELCRQQQLDIVMLTAVDRWWLPALLHDGQLYLFDTRLGLPLPGKATDSVATLADLIAEPGLLDQLSIDGQQYPIAAKDLEQISARLVATPLQLAKRSHVLEQALEGSDYVVLSANTKQIAQALEKQSALTSVQLWTFPFSSILAEHKMSAVQRLRATQRFLPFAQRPRLWKARALHFQGTKEVPLEDRNDPLARPELGHQQAIALYQDPRVRPPAALLKEIDATKRAIYEAAKGDASYWLGLLSFDLGRYRVAEDWLARRTLAARPDGPWTTGASYNLARTHEALGELPKAIELLQADQSPQRYGNLLRAQRLQQQLETSEDSASTE